jgi:ankyrin repeat protein
MKKKNDILKGLTALKKIDPKLAKKFAESGILAEAAYEGNLEAIKLAIALECDINIKYGYDDMTILMTAAGRGHKKIVKLLVKNGACIGRMDDDNDTPAAYARQCGHSEIADYLLKLEDEIYAKKYIV